MHKGRLEAFSDGVMAVLITIMVLELRPPDEASWAALRPMLPEFFSYVLSFVFLGIYWNNHHHMLQASGSVNGRALWANHHLLFWLSLVPFSTAWMGRAGASAIPTATYGIVLLMSAIAYTILLRTLTSHEGPGSRLAQAIGGDGKGWLSMVLYVSAIPLAFVRSWIAIGIYVTVALIWLIPDRRLEPVRKHAVTHQGVM